jgi:glycosyltransferase involved in cell wall biosynthesis
MRLAMIADWLTTFGGAEHVLAECAALYPDAPIFTTVARKGALGPLDRVDIRVSSLQRAYRLLGNHQVLLPWMPRAVERFDLSGYDVVLSSSHAVAKGVLPRPGTLHVCYCHTPVRYAWEMEEEYLRDFRVPKRLRRPIKRELSRLRRWDLTTALRVDRFLANSTTTQERITRIYARESVVVPPPVDDRFFTVGIRDQGSGIRDQGAYFLAVGRLVPYKRFDLLIAVANDLGLRLKIAGRGQDEARLRALAGPTVEFLGFVPDAELPGLYAGAHALLFPQYEDAGIVLLEAQACGTPAIAYRAGGATDAVDDGKTGLFFGAQTEEAVRGALREFEVRSWDRAAIRAHARRFTQAEFRRKMRAEIEGAWEAFRSTRAHAS